MVLLVARVQSSPLRMMMASAMAITQMRSRMEWSVLLYSRSMEARQALRLARGSSRTMISWLKGTAAAESDLNCLVMASIFSGGTADAGCAEDGGAGDVDGAVIAGL